MRARFFWSETVIGLRRNFLMSLALVIVLGISLFLLGGGWLMYRQAGLMRTFWFNQLQVSVYLTNGVTQAERDQINQQLVALPQVERVTYISKQQAYENFRKAFSDQPDLIKDASPDVLPESFVVKLKDPRQFSIVKSAMTGQPGVDNVQDEHKQLKTIFGVLDGFRNGAWVIALLALAAAISLVATTMKVAAFSRRRETGIMRLVGASNIYIQLPFVLEGALAGLLGGLAAAPLLILAKWGLIDHLLEPSLRFTPWIGWVAVEHMLPVIFIIGMALSSIAATLTLQRYLRV